MRRVIVFSGINIASGGPLTIMNMFARFADSVLSEHHQVFFLIKRKELIDKGNYQIIEFPNAKKFGLAKIFYEYFYFKKLSKKLKPHCWISLNDCTPSVVATIRCAYFHNSSPLYKPVWLDILFPSVILLQIFYYRLLYRINIYKNRYIIVQQETIKRFIERQYTIPGRKIIVSRPFEKIHYEGNEDVNKPAYYTFIYPTKPIVYKNVHIILSAVRMIRQISPNLKFRVLLTLSGRENRYSRYLYRNGKNLEEVNWLGKQENKNLMDYYKSSDCLLFPSRLETWGLPISEAIAFKKFILAADLPYSKETVGTYPYRMFFDPLSPRDLAEKMIAAVTNPIAISNIDDSNIVIENEMAKLFKKILE